MKRLRCGLLGLAGAGRELYDALRDAAQIELVAVADRDRSLTAKLAELAEATPYDDHRLLIVECSAGGAAGGVDALFVALPVFEAQEYLRVAAGRTPVVYVVPPFARDFETALELGRLFDGGEHRLVVARPWLFEPAYAGLKELAELAGHVHAAQGEVTEAVDDAAEWIGDSRRAGGGTLLHGGYQMVDMMVALLGIPDAVFAATGFRVPAGQARAHDTEDAASLVFRYGGDRTAGLTCRRVTSGPTWRLTLSGSKATVVVTPGGFRVLDCCGELIEEGVVRSPNRFVPAVSALAVALATGTADLPSKVGDHLGTLATIGAAYLSVRTAQAEAPHRFLELAGGGRR